MSTAKFTYKLKSDTGYEADGEANVSPQQYQALVSIMQPRYAAMPAVVREVADGNHLQITFERDLTDEDLIAVRLLLKRRVTA